MYHLESRKIHDKLLICYKDLKGETVFTLGGETFAVEGKDGLGGLIEEWFGVWAEKEGFNIHNPKKEGHSQEFPDYYVGEDKSLLEIKTFDATAGANFDIANFDSYCKSLAENPFRIDADYLIFSYKLDGASLSIEKIWLKKIWEITCGSERYPLKTQIKKDVIYNIRPASWDSKRARYKVFDSKEGFVDALYSTQEKYNSEVKSYRELYEKNITNA